MSAWAPPCPPCLRISGVSATAGPTAARGGPSWASHSWQCAATLRTCLPSSPWAGHLGATRYLVTNVIPYTAEMRHEILYGRALSDIAYPALALDTARRPPENGSQRADGPPSVRRAAQPLQCQFCGSQPGRGQQPLSFHRRGRGRDRLGRRVQPVPAVAARPHELPQRPPAMQPPLQRRQPGRAHSGGHYGLRRIISLSANACRPSTSRPCTFCGGCDCSLANEEDCFGNPFPTCGGCLWAQGIIRCP